MVTATATAPATCIGAVTVSELPSPATATLVPAAPPKVTAVAPVRLVPETVTVLPPAAEPDVGATLVTVGAGVPGVQETVTLIVPLSVPDFSVRTPIDVSEPTSV